MLTTLLWLLVLTWTATISSANTEIRKFQVDAIDDPVSVVLPASVSQWLSLDFPYSEKELTLLPARFGTFLSSVCETKVDATKPTVNSPYGCPHELFLVLNLDANAWRKYDAYTLRLSWPASYPAEFDIQILSASMLSELLESNPNHTWHGNPQKVFKISTRTRYARIRVVDTGVVTPKRQLPSPLPSVVPFTLILEPLYLGFLPASVMPTLLLMLPVAASAFIIVPRLLPWFESLAQDAMQETKSD
ncbi:hypothetical protein ONZ45_g16525 [Pleurotus djamor]|nr:hypothetical protein ONZ45_g16525 [Pleurotus djamor]